MGTGNSKSPPKSTPVFNVSVFLGKRNPTLPPVKTN